MHEINTPFRITALYSAINFKWDSDFVFYGEHHDFWEIVTVLKGAVEVVENEQAYLMRDGEMILHAPNEFHRIKSACGTSPHVLILSFANEGALPASLKEGVFSLSEEQLTDYLNLFSPLFDFFEHPEQRAEDDGMCCKASAARHQLESFLLSLSLRRASQTGLNKNAGAEVYRNLVKTMNEHANEPLTLEKLASLHHVSISYVKKLFYTYTGEGPMSYFTSLRIKEIRRLLTEGYRISEISAMMGFSSPAYLSVFFKKNTGISPSKYTAEKRSQ